MLRLKRYIALFSLLAFLFPQALNLVHELEHRNDFHCSEKFVKHFHEEEHHCDICDFVPLVSGDTKIEHLNSYLPFSSTVNYSIALIEQTSSSDLTYAFLRGPSVM